MPSEARPMHTWRRLFTCFSSPVDGCSAVDSPVAARRACKPAHAADGVRGPSLEESTSGSGVWRPSSSFELDSCARKHGGGKPGGRGRAAAMPAGDCEVGAASSSTSIKRASVTHCESTCGSASATSVDVLHSDWAAMLTSAMGGSAPAVHSSSTGATALHTTACSLSAATTAACEQPEPLRAATAAAPPAAGAAAAERASTSASAGFSGRTSRESPSAAAVASLRPSSEFAFASPEQNCCQMQVACISLLSASAHAAAFNQAGAAAAAAPPDPQFSPMQSAENDSPRYLQPTTGSHLMTPALPWVRLEGAEQLPKAMSSGGALILSHEGVEQQAQQQQQQQDFSFRSSRSAMPASQPLPRPRLSSNDGSGTRSSDGLAAAAAATEHKSRAPPPRSSSSGCFPTAAPVVPLAAAAAAATCRYGIYSSLVAERRAKLASSKQASGATTPASMLSPTPSTQLLCLAASPAAMHSGSSLAHATIHSAPSCLVPAHPPVVPPHAPMAPLPATYPHHHHLHHATSSSSSTDFHPPPSPLASVAEMETSAFLAALGEQRRPTRLSQEQPLPQPPRSSGQDERPAALCTSRSLEPHQWPGESAHQLQVSVAQPPVHYLPQHCYEGAAAGPRPQYLATRVESLRHKLRAQARELQAIAEKQQQQQQGGGGGGSGSPARGSGSAMRGVRSAHAVGIAPMVAPPAPASVGGSFGRIAGHLHASTGIGGSLRYPSAMTSASSGGFASRALATAPSWSYSMASSEAMEDAEEERCRAETTLSYLRMLSMKNTSFCTRIRRSNTQDAGVGVGGFPAAAPPGCVAGGRRCILGGEQ